MTDCIVPATDGVQTATYGRWRLLQGNEITTLFDLTLDGAAVPNWVDRLAVVNVWNGTALLTIAGANIAKSAGPTPTTVAVKILAAQVAVPTITGWYRIGTTALDGTGYTTHRYGPFIVGRAMYDDGILP